MKNIGIILLIFCYLTCCIPIFTNASTESTVSESTSFEPISDVDTAVIDGSYSIDALTPVLGTGKLVDNVRSAVVFEANSRTLMYTWNPDVQMYPASLVKIMTALLAIEYGDLSDIVTVSETAVNSVPYDAVSAKLAIGECICLEDLLYCLLVGSANDAAAVIAEHVSGSQNAFVEKMNHYAQEIGCVATHFTNAHGLHDDNQHTTARDCVRILDAAMMNPKFREIFTANEHTIQATNLSAERHLSSGNSMKDSNSKLYYDPRAIGGRTGVTNDGRRCFASVAESNGMSLISVVLGAESVYQEDGYSAISIGGYKETTKLYDACFESYKLAQILQADQVLRQVSVEGAQNDLLIGSQLSVASVLPRDTVLENLSLLYVDKPLSLPILKGQYVSDLQIWNGDACVAQVRLFAMNGLNYADSNVDELSENADNEIPIVLWVVLAVTTAIAVVLILIRSSASIKKIFSVMRKKRYRRSRKRVQ